MVFPDLSLILNRGQSNQMRINVAANGFYNNIMNNHSENWRVISKYSVKKKHLYTNSQ
jgi:hypothetical protein